MLSDNTRFHPSTFSLELKLEFPLAEFSFSYLDNTPLSCPIAGRVKSRRATPQFWPWHFLYRQWSVLKWLCCEENSQSCLMRDESGKKKNFLQIIDSLTVNSSISGITHYSNNMTNSLTFNDTHKKVFFPFRLLTFFVKYLSTMIKFVLIKVSNSTIYTMCIRDWKACHECKEFMLFLLLLVVCFAEKGKVVYVSDSLARA